MTNKDEKTSLATFGAGCFWGVEAAFRKMDGVVETAVGYMGGHTENPTYDEVCTGKTGHAEVVRITYDPRLTTYDKLLKIFWEVHDSTQLNMQGPDVGTQYRSIIFYHTPEQKVLAEKSLNRLQRSGKHNKPIVTEIVSVGEFTRAEEYHQLYLEKRGVATCHPNLA